MDFNRENGRLIKKTGIVENQTRATKIIDEGTVDKVLTLTVPVETCSG